MQAPGWGERLTVRRNRNLNSEGSPAKESGGFSHRWTAFYFVVRACK
jgi:hypothetical protein